MSLFSLRTKPVTHSGNGSRHFRSLRHLGEDDLCDPLSLTADFYGTMTYTWDGIWSYRLRQSDAENYLLYEFGTYELYIQV